MSKSKVVKASFVSMSDIRKEIKVVDPKDPKIINPLPDLSLNRGDAAESTEKSLLESAIDDDVIDGSTSMLLESAKEEADLIVAEARGMALQIREDARLQGFDNGYSEGIEASRDELAERTQALIDKEKTLEEAFENKLREAEPKIAGVINDLVNSMVGHYAKEPSTIIFLIRLALSEITAFGSFILKVSPADFDYVMEHKSSLTEGLSEKVEVEVLRDNTLEPLD